MPAPVESLSEFIIEKGVPLPPKPRGKTTRYPWLDLAAGDSFFIPLEDREEAKKVANRLISTGGSFYRRHGMPSAVVAGRVVDGGVRIWRVK